ncbi:hypothetical protein HZI73_25250 [Vallitalea pronyensis]|uniref:Uncharacterized protein n=1 Tax=Vallitalea pronyensis TaxID=1348613 RepID=A0A8J8MPX6_9FIRM|nr:hypothetical protein [Vallitalea pronyensis]QUI25401.1 hypothetical protein HZI73_25250 [Vallitalea pronyensis]
MKKNILMLILIISLFLSMGNLSVTANDVTSIKVEREVEREKALEKLYERQEKSGYYKLVEGEKSNSYEEVDLTLLSDSELQGIVDDLNSKSKLITCTVYPTKESMLQDTNRGSSAYLMTFTPTYSYTNGLVVMQGTVKLHDGGDISSWITRIDGYVSASNVFSADDTWITGKNYLPLDTFYVYEELHLYHTSNVTMYFVDGSITVTTTNTTPGYLGIYHEADLW